MSRIALGVSGGIGAYKAVEVCRGLQQRGHDVVAVMTRSAARFVGPVTFEAITRRPVITSQWRPGMNSDIEHIAIADQIALPAPSEPQPATRCPQCGKDHAAGVVCSACGTVINVDGECACDTAGWVNGQPVHATPPAAAGERLNEIEKRWRAEADDEAGLWCGVHPRDTLRACADELRRALDAAREARQ